MALVRCLVCAKETRKYVSHVFPVGYPRGGVICGRPPCRLPGLIWLEPKEARAYDRGERVFRLASAASKVRARKSNLKGNRVGNTVLQPPTG